VNNTPQTFWFVSLLQTICDLHPQILSTWRKPNSTFHVIAKLVQRWWAIIKVQKELSLITSQIPKICCSKTRRALLKFLNKLCKTRLSSSNYHKALLIKTAHNSCLSTF
jgi:hypothetical protein